METLSAKQPWPSLISRVSLLGGLAGFVVSALPYFYPATNQWSIQRKILIFILSLIIPWVLCMGLAFLKVAIRRAIQFDTLHNSALKFQSGLIEEKSITATLTEALSADGVAVFRTIGVKRNDEGELGLVIEIKGSQPGVGDVLLITDPNRSRLWGRFIVTETTRLGVRSGCFARPKGNPDALWWGNVHKNFNESSDSPANTIAVLPIYREASDGNDRGQSSSDSE